jgi:predicted acetyltransferase
MNDYATSVQDRITQLIQLTKNTYERITSNDTLSPYEFNKELDELSELIIRILFYKKQLFRIVNAEEELDHIPTREEYNKIRLQRLLNDKAMYEEQNEIIDKAIKDIGENKKMQRLVNNLEMEKFHNQTSLGAIMSKLRVYEQKPDLTDGEIDIYLNNTEGEISFRGIIYLHNTSTEIGQIDYRGPCESKWLGDIGYTINTDYRGNNYAYKALELISPLIASKGIEKVTITTHEGNIASVKTIEKFGGVLTDTVHGDVLSYTCYIKQISKNNKTKR